MEALTGLVSTGGHLSQGCRSGAAIPCKVWYSATLGSNAECSRIHPTNLSVIKGWGLALYLTPYSLHSWDRNQKRRRHSGQQSSGRQQESQQPLTDLSPTTVSILGPYGDPLTPTPEAEQSRQGQEGAEKLGGHGKNAAFQLNR